MIASSKKLNTLFEAFKVKFGHNPDLVSSTSTLIELSHKILQNCHHLDVSNVPANGFRSVIMKFEQLLAYSLKLQHQKEVTEFQEIIKQINRVLPFLEEHLHESWDEQIEFSEKHIEQLVFVMNFISSEEEQDKSFAAVFSDVFLQFDHKTTGNFLIWFCFMFTSYTVSKSVGSRLSCMFSKEKRMKIVRNYYRNCDVNDFLKILSESKHVMYERIFPFMSSGFGPSTTRVVKVPRQNRWKIQVNGPQKKIEVIYRKIDANKATDTGSRVSCFLNRQDDSKGLFNGHVLVYVHGGGFIANSMRATNNFLFNFARKMPGMSILSVDVTPATSAKYPAQAQEVLDVILWLQSNNESVMQSLGCNFSPDKIYLAGDSSGAFTMMQAFITLNEINHCINSMRAEGGDSFRENNVKIPDHIFTLSPALVVIPTLFPSMSLALKDMMLFPSAVSHMAFSILPDLLDEEGKVIASARTWNEGKSFFLKPVDQMKECLMQYSWFFRDPLFNPVFYEKMQDFSHVTLHFVSSHDDPVIDLGLAFLPKWKGKLTMDVLPVLKHGWFYFLSIGRAFFPSVRKRITHSEDLLVQRFHDTLSNSSKKPPEVNENVENFKIHEGMKQGMQ